MAKVVATVTFESDDGDLTSFTVEHELSEGFSGRYFYEAAEAAATEVYLDVREHY